MILAVTPGNMWIAWSWEPSTLVALFLATAIYLHGVMRLWAHAGRGRGARPWQVAAYLMGIFTLFIALISPLDALSETLLSAHMTQHLLLMVLAAPLLAMSRPVAACLWSLPPAWRRSAGRAWRDARLVRAVWRGLTNPGSILVLFTVSLWVWHIPSLYQAALENDGIHALEHICFLVTALLFWWNVFSAGEPGKMGHGPGVIYVFVAGMQGTLLGVLFTFSQSLWYPFYAGSTAAWHIRPLQDQQLAGLVMWIPSSFIYLGVTCVMFVVWLSGMDRRQEREVIPLDEWAGDTRRVPGHYHSVSGAE